MNSRGLDFLAPARAPGELGWLAHYRVIRLLGQGGMGMVFQAEDTELQRAVALKVMKTDLAQNPAAHQRFLREARAMAGVRSEHIVTVHQVGLENGLPFMAMELLPGLPLDGWLARAQRPTVAQILDIGLQVAKGLDAAHRSGLIHRDIKPANIWLEEATGRVKILDFGLARPAQEDSRLTQTGIIIGTPSYMAPEQAEGEGVDARCDLFSLGCVLYELAAGRPPFRGASTLAVLKAAALNEPDPLAEQNPALPTALADLVSRLLAKTPAGRPASAGVVIDVLQDIAAARTSTARALLSGVSLKAQTPAQSRRKALIVGGAAGLAALLAMGSFLAMRNGTFSRATGDGPASPDSGSPIRASTAQGVTNDEILLGMSAPFSGSARDLGSMMQLGIQTYFEHVNDEGGVVGRRLTIVPLDDGYEPNRALANMEELFERRKVFGILGNVGTPTTEKTLPYALQKRMLFFGAFSGAPLLRKDPPDRYVFNYRASYEEETAAIVKYLVEIKKIRPEHIAVFAQKDGYGDAGFRGVAKRMRGYGRDSDKILRVGHQRNSVDIDEALGEVLKHKDLRAMVMVSTYRPAARFIQKAKDAKMNLVFANVSFVGSTSLAEELSAYGPDYMDGVIVTQVVPPIESQSSAVLKYRELLAKYHPNEQPSFVSLEGYLDAAVLVEGGSDEPATTSRPRRSLAPWNRSTIWISAPAPQSITGPPSTRLPTKCGEACWIARSSSRSWTLNKESHSSVGPGQPNSPEFGKPELWRVPLRLNPCVVGRMVRPMDAGSCKIRIQRPFVESR